MTKIETLQWEMELLIKSKTEVMKEGRELHYYEEERIKKIRNLLDKEMNYEEKDQSKANS